MWWDTQPDKVRPDFSLTFKSFQLRMIDKLFSYNQVDEYGEHVLYMGITLRKKIGKYQPGHELYAINIDYKNGKLVMFENQDDQSGAVFNLSLDLN